MSSLPPSETVFTIPELLESILLNLDLRTLLTTAQSTCRTWTTLIKTSPRLQQALFLLPAPTAKKAHNPLLAQTFPSLFSAPAPSSHSSPENSDQDKDTNPLCLFTFTTLDMVATPAKTEAYRRREASWRHMLLQQPPISEIGFIQIRSAMRGKSYTQFKIVPRSKDGESERQAGLRMRHVFGWLLFGSRVRRVEGRMRVIWCRHADVEIPTVRRNPELSVAYERMVGRFEVVFDERYTVRCVRGGPRLVGEEERLWGELRELYGGLEGREEGFVVEEVDIKESILRGDV